MSLDTTRRTILSGGAMLAGSAMLPAAAQAGKVMVVACNSEIPSFDPHVTSGYASSMLMRNVYSPLVASEGDPPTVEPRIAKSWTVSPDGLTYTFALDATARFHDDTPVTADDVIYSFKRLMRLGKGGAWMVAGLLDDNSMTSKDPHEVVFTLKKPFSALLQVLPWLAIISSKVVEANKGSDDGQGWFLKNALGSGAFKLTRSEPGNLFEFRRVANGWRQGGGNLDAYIWKIVRETATQRLQIQQGQAHVAMDLTSEDMDSIRGRAGIVLIEKPDYRTFSIKMNCKEGPLTDVNLRQAISYAFDYDAMLAISGQAKLMTGPLPDGMFAQDASLAVPRKDLAKAKDYLAKTKYANGGLKLRAVYVQGLEQERRWCLVLLDNLKAIGIEVDVGPMAWTDVVAGAGKPATTPDFVCLYQSANYADPDNVASAVYHSSRNGTWTNPTYGDPKVDAVIDEARTTTDPAKRKALYAQFQKMVVADAPDIFGVLEARKIALRSNVQNYRFTPIAANAFDFFPMSIA